MVDDVAEEGVEVQVLTEIPDSAVVIDIRHPNELELKALTLAGNAANEILQIPFYELRSGFDQLDKSCQYLLYCEKGMMSRLHAANLMDEGFQNVAVLDQK